MTCATASARTINCSSSIYIESSTASKISIHLIPTTINRPTTISRSENRSFRTSEGAKPAPSFLTAEYRRHFYADLRRRQQQVIAMVDLGHGTAVEPRARHCCLRLEAVLRLQRHDQICNASCGGPRAAERPFPPRKKAPDFGRPQSKSVRSTQSPTLSSLHSSAPVPWPSMNLSCFGCDNRLSQRQKDNAHVEIYREYADSYDAC